MLAGCWGTAGLSCPPLPTCLANSLLVLPENCLGWGWGRLQLEAVGLGSAGARKLGSTPSPEPAQPSPPTPSWCARHLRQRRAGLLSGFYLLWVFPSDSQDHKNPPRLLVPGALAVPRCPLSPGPPHAVQHRPCSAACGDTDGRGSPWQT